MRYCSRRDNIKFISSSLNGQCHASPAEVEAFVISIRCAKCTAGAKSNGSIRRRTSARCMSFSRTSMDFSALAKSHRNPLLIMWLQFAFVFLKSYLIFSKKRSKVIYFEGPRNPWGSCACCLFLLE